MGPATLSRSFLLSNQPTPLVGRTAELETIRQRLVAEGVRLLTLTGPAGVGKTRLALAAAVQVADHFPDGVTVADLAPVRDPVVVLPVIARALGIPDTGPLPLSKRLCDVLRERALLLVLDNFEQVLPAAVLLADLVANCPGLALLVTSRRPLQLRWEQMLRIAPLPVPNLRAALPPLHVLLVIPSVALFVDRARAHRVDFALTEKLAPLVAQLTVELDGLPLALELAAARLDVLSLPTLVRRLGVRLRLLASEAPDRPERQRSLEAAVGWSYDLLSAPERLLFRCLGVFVGRVSLDAITAVASRVSRVSKMGAMGGEAGDGEPREARKEWEEREEWEAGRTLQRLLSLAERSLVLPLSTRPEEPGGQPGQPVHDSELEEPEDEDQEPAFGMLATVREYAQELLAAEGELAAAQRAHALYFLALAEHAERELRGHAQRAWLLQLEREQDNLRTALRWLLDQDGPAEQEAALRLAEALGWFWLRRGYHSEGRRWLEEALARTPQDADADLAARTRALLIAGELVLLQNDVAPARAMLEEALALAEQRQDPAAIAEAHTYLGLCVVLAGEVAEGTRLLREALRRWEALGDPQGLGITHFNLAHAADAMGDVATAAEHYTAALPWLDAAGDAHLAGFVHCYLGVNVWKLGDLRSAVDQVRVGVQISLTLRDRHLLSFGAREAVALVGAGAEPTQRVRLLGAADALAQATGATLMWERMPTGQDVVGLREQLAREEKWGAAYREGRSLPFGEVAALALTLLEEVAQALAPTDTALDSAQQPEPLSQPTQLPDRYRSPLSAREQEVLRLVATGLSSKAIGRQLFIAPSTVNYHLTSIFNKLGVDTRAQAVALAAQRGLL